MSGAAPVVGGPALAQLLSVEVQRIDLEPAAGQLVRVTQTPGADVERRQRGPPPPQPLDPAREDLPSELHVSRIASLELRDVPPAIEDNRARGLEMVVSGGFAAPAVGSVPA